MAYNIAMSEDLIAKLVFTLQQYPVLTLLFVFLVAFTESLIIVGLVVPGAVLMIITGALIAMNAIDLWYAILVAIVGAISGDSLSYWLGKRYQQQLQTIWPLSRHPELIQQANLFFKKHGVKSIALARFIGLLRPVIPAVAGMSKMPWKPFLAANIVSAIAWAPLYLLPGILFGLSIEIASEFAGKFIFIIVLFLIISIIFLWLIQRIYTYSKPTRDKFIDWCLTWGEKHRVTGEVPAAIFDKSHPELRGLTYTAVVILIITIASTYIYEAILIEYQLIPFDINSFNQLVYYSLQELRTPPLDNVMLWFAYIGSYPFLVLLFAVVSSYLFLKKDYFSLWHWLAALLLPLLLIPVLNNDLVTELQQQTNLGIPSAPFVVVLSSLGFFTVILNTGLSFARQKLIFYLSAIFTFFIALSQLYFATQLFSQLLSGLLLGIIWFNLLAIAYRRHKNKSTTLKTRQVIFYLFIILLIHPSIKTVKTENIYPVNEDYFVMATDSWIDSGWESLPVIRKSVYTQKNRLFNLQWLGTKQLIEKTLTESGFSKSNNSLKAYSNWFLKKNTIEQFPVLPYIHKGKYEDVRYYYHDKVNQELIVIRLWRSIYQLVQEKPEQPLWFGVINYMGVKTNLGINYLVTKSKAVKQLPIKHKNIKIVKKPVKNENVVFLLMEN